MKANEIKLFLYSFEHPLTGLEDWEIYLVHIAEGLYKAKAIECRQNLKLDWFVLNYEEEKEALEAVIKEIHRKIKP